jgi:hypothetical protein
VTTSNGFAIVEKLGVAGEIAADEAAGDRGRDSGAGARR